MNLSLAARLARLARLALLPAALATTASHAAPVAQWASKVISVSSEYNGCPNAWSSCQATGAPDTVSYGDIGTAWATAGANDGKQTIALGFAVPVYSTGALIRETFGNGFVVSIAAIDDGGTNHVVWSGTDDSTPGSPVDFVVDWSQTEYLTTGLLITIDTDHNPETWEEIDAVQLKGVDGQTTEAIPEPASLAMVALGLLALTGTRRRR